MKKYILSTFLVLTFSNLSAVVIIIHGTFATTEKWSRPGGKFYQAVEKKAKEFNQKVVPFTWPGGASDKDRIQGAEALAKIILSYPSNEKIILVGHSHGGNVINFASQLLGLTDNNNTILNDVENKPKEARPWYWFIQKILASLFRNNKNLQTSPNELEEILVQAFISIENTRKELKTVNPIPTKFPIDKVYLLGTPIDQEFYGPNMDVIREIYNFYSKGDSIQQVLGLFKRLIINLPRTVNLRVTIDDQGVADDPSHEEIHSYIVGKWLLDIPFKLKNKKLNGFEFFRFNKNGKIHFDKNGQPWFKLDKRTTEEREEKEANRAKKR